MSRRKKWTITILSILGVIIIGIGAYAFSMYNLVEKTVSQMHHRIDRDKSDKRTEQIVVEDRDPISILLIGVDQYEGEKGRSDTLIVMTVNPTDKSMKMLSIPRDTRTEIIGKGYKDKINHSFVFGGPEMTINTVENFLNVPIDYFVQINMQSFKDIVDSVGGITVQNSFAFNYDGHKFPEGTITLNGSEALAYARMRKRDPRGDFGRQVRQKQVIMAVIDKGARISSLNKYDDILTVLGKNVKTNMTFDEMKDIQKNYKEARHNLEHTQIKGSGAMIDGIYYYEVPESERNAISTKLRQHLELE